MATSFTSLWTNQVHTNVESFQNMLGVADHVHDQDAGGVQALDDVAGRHADGADEQLGAALDGDGYELVQLAVRVVVVGLARVAADLRQREVDAERQLNAVRALDVWRTPTVLLVDGTGSVLRRAAGVPARDELTAALRPLLAQGRR